jgi:hypothetical protein
MELKVHIWCNEKNEKQPVEYIVTVPDQAVIVTTDLAYALSAILNRLT